MPTRSETFFLLLGLTVGAGVGVILSPEDKSTALTECRAIVVKESRDAERARQIQDGALLAAEKATSLAEKCFRELDGRR